MATKLLVFRGGHRAGHGRLRRVKGRPVGGDAETAQAAGKSRTRQRRAALAARKSPIWQALQRPSGAYCGYPQNGGRTDLWVIVLVLKNYGTLPAMNVAADD